MTLLPDHWRTFVDSMRGGAIRDLGCRGIDFSALDDDALMVAVGFRGLRSLLVYRSIFSSRFVTDDLIRASVANSLSSLTFSDNTGVDSPLRFSQDAVLDFFFRAYTPFESRSYYLSLDGSGVTDTFLVRLFDRRPSGIIIVAGSLQLSGAAKQDGLSAYARYLVRGGTPGAAATYSFPVTADSDLCYEVDVRELSICMSVGFRPVGSSAS